MLGPLVLDLHGEPPTGPWPPNWKPQLYLPSMTFGICPGIEGFVQNLLRFWGLINILVDLLRAQDLYGHGTI